MEKTEILNGIIKAVTDAVNGAAPGHKLSAAINAIGTSVRITFVDGTHGKHSMQFNVENNGKLTLHNIHLPSGLIGKGIMTEALKAIRELPGLNGECHVALALNDKGWRTILKRAGFASV